MAPGMSGVFMGILFLNGISVPSRASGFQAAATKGAVVTDKATDLGASAWYAVWMLVLLYVLSFKA
jgi:hypothetical protein